MICFERRTAARSLQPGKHPRPLTRREVPATPPSLEACFHARSLQPGKHPRPLTRREAPATPPSLEACFHARSLQPGKHPRPLTRREAPATPPSLEACFHARSLQPGKLPRPLTRREAPAIPPSPGACFHAGSLQPGKHPRPLTRREAPAIPPSLGRTSMQASAVENCRVGERSRTSLRSFRASENCLKRRWCPVSESRVSDPSPTRKSEDVLPMMLPVPLEDAERERLLGMVRSRSLPGADGESNLAVAGRVGARAVGKWRRCRYLEGDRIDSFGRTLQPQGFLLRLGRHRRIHPRQDRTTSTLVSGTEHQRR